MLRAATKVNFVEGTEKRPLGMPHACVGKQVAPFTGVTGTTRSRSERGLSIDQKGGLFGLCVVFLAQVVVVANPANTNALILKEFAPSFPAKNITCLTRLDHSNARWARSRSAWASPVANVKNTIIWGNHSSTQ